MTRAADFGAPAAHVSGAQVVWFAQVSDVPGRLREVQSRLETLPPTLRAELGPLLDPAQREARWGFDPLQVSGWRAAGLDATADAAAVLDARLAPPGHTAAPFYLVPIVDREKLLSVLRKAFSTLTVGESDGQTELARLGDRVWVIGRAGAYAAILPVESSRLAEVRPVFAAALAVDDDASLARDERFRRANAGLDASAWLRVYASTAVGARARGVSESLGDHVASLFPSASAWLSDGRLGARLVTSSAGNDVVDRLVRSAAPPPALARYVPARGFGALRLSLDLTDFFSGVAAGLPPGTDKLRTGILMGKAMISFMAGFGWEELAAALTGHVLLAADVNGAVQGPSGLASLDWVVALGVRDRAAMDALVPKVVAFASKRLPGVVAGEATVRGAPAHTLSAFGLTAVAVRQGDVYLIGPSAASLEAAAARALAPADSLEPSPAGRAMNGPALTVAALDVTPLFAIASRMPGVQALLDTSLFAPLRAHPILAIGLTLDADGLQLLDLSDVGLTAALPVMGAAMYLRASALAAEPASPN